MKEINELVKTKIDELTTNGFLEQAIEKRLEETLNEAVESAMKSYSDFGRAIKEKLESSINASLSSVTFPEYNDIICKIASEKMEQILSNKVDVKITEIMHETLTPVPDSITGQELLDKIQDYFSEDGESKEIYLDWKVSDNEHAVYLEVKHPEYDWENIKMSIYNHRDEGFTIGYIDENSHKQSESIGGSTYTAVGLISYIYKLYANSTTIEDLLDYVDVESVGGTY